MLIQAGYTNAKALKGGVAAWKEAGSSPGGEGSGRCGSLLHANLPSRGNILA